MKLAAGLVLLAALAACGNEKTGPSPVASAIGAMAKGSVAKLKARKAGGTTAGKTATPEERRAKLEAAGKPVMQASSATLGQAGFLSLFDTKGDVLTWKTPDGVTFTQRGGVLIQTRGLGADLMSAEVPSVAHLMRAGEAYRRIYYFLGPDDQGTRRTYECVTTVTGREDIEVLGRRHATTHLTETCTRPQGTQTNEYWVEGASIRKSRQWVSGAIGHVDFERVID